MPTSPRVAIIGAGCSGLTALKNCLERDLDVVCFEAGDDLGGNWRFSASEGHSSVYETTHIISSKTLSAYLDFPMPEHYPDYPSHEQVLAYFESYADHFDLRPHIRFNTRVERVTTLPENRWEVDGEPFDFLLVANGHHNDPRHPEGVRENFGGRYLHSHSYKHNRDFANERVLVIGAGNSACDCAVEISRTAARTDLSVRRAQYIIPKFFLGRPVDTYNRALQFLPRPLRKLAQRLTLALMVGNYADYDLPEPSEDVTRSHPTLNSELLYRIRHGKVTPRPGIARIEDRTVHFKDGTATEYDTIVAATGYKISFPFFNRNLVDYAEADRIPLYLRMFHPDHPSLIFIGLFQPQGAIWPLSDAQSRLAAAYIAGDYTLPADLRKRAEADSDRIAQDFNRSKRHTIEVHYHPFLKRLLREAR